MISLTQPTALQGFQKWFLLPQPTALQGFQSFFFKTNQQP